MDLGIKGKKAIVNGGSSGMGKGAVLALAKEGVEIFVSARGKERLIGSCDEIMKLTGASITPIVADHSTDHGRALILSACPEPDIFIATCAPPAFTGDFHSVNPGVLTAPATAQYPGMIALVLQAFEANGVTLNIS